MTISRLEERNHKELSEHLEGMELFALGKVVIADKVIEFYKDDFDASLLISHQAMFLYVVLQRNQKMESLTDGI